MAIQDQVINEKKFEEVKKIIEEQEDRLQKLQSTGFQLANYYFVFQGVILTASCNGTTSLKCKDRWFLFTVSLLAAVLNLVALVIIGLKYCRTIELQEHNRCEFNEIARRLLRFMVAGVLFVSKTNLRTRVTRQQAGEGGVIVNVSGFVMVALAAAA
ncbi:hypothetical protein Q3G72_020333 [Acer saccharum]|nr:hypothetical protein Q3G72_020333 [Acer saccharum]